jgi:hypothetical protein
VGSSGWVGQGGQQGVDTISGNEPTDISLCFQALLSPEEH